MYTTQKEIRAAFSEQHPNLQRRKIRNYAGNGKMHCTDTRVAFVDFVEYLQRDGQIIDAVANRVTLRACANP